MLKFAISFTGVRGALSTAEEVLPDQPSAAMAFLASQPKKKGHRLRLDPHELARAKRFILARTDDVHMASKLATMSSDQILELALAFPEDK